QYASSIKVTTENFQRFNYARQENNESKRYQVNLTEENRDILCSVQASTGLTLGEIVQECFHQQNCISPRPLNTLDNLSTTQQNIMLGSIIGDSTLRHTPLNLWESEAVIMNIFLLKKLLLIESCKFN
ncbi:hypothetical protein CSV77_16685, partial [Sporosarcina sp. P16b]|uniref:hypothetical protein n=1 Tax=Sporosarcina sp. P16b TaxID=2048261 RepID=UPI000C58993C